MKLSSLSPRVRSALVWLLVLAVLWTVWRAYGFTGVALAVSALVFWLLAQFTRVMQLMKKAATRPKGHVTDAAQMHRRLRPGTKLIDVVQLTGSLGEPMGEGEAEGGAAGERLSWTDSAGVRVSCEFVDGRLVRWELGRSDPAAPQT